MYNFWWLLKEYNSRQLCLGCLAMAEQCSFPFKVLAAPLSPRLQKKKIPLSSSQAHRRRVLFWSGKEILTDFNVTKKIVLNYNLQSRYLSAEINGIFAGELMEMKISCYIKWPYYVI